MNGLKQVNYFRLTQFKLSLQDSTDKHENTIKDFRMHACNVDADQVDEGLR
jgi:hypothetical protein